MYTDPLTLANQDVGPRPFRPSIDEAEMAAARRSEVLVATPPDTPAADTLAAAMLEARYRTLLQQMSAIVVMVSLDHQAAEVYASPAIEAALGISREEWQSDPLRWTARIHPGDQERWTREIEQLLASGDPLRADYRMTGADGKLVWLHCQARLVRHPDGRPWFVQGVALDVSAERRLERAMLEIGDQEQRRIGRELHDGLGQHLTGIAFLTKVLERKLANKGLAEAADAERIVTLVNEAIGRTRELARGLLPVPPAPHGLAAALRQIAADVEDLFRVACTVECTGKVAVGDPQAAGHLCRIAREAVHNAIRHGGAKEVVISLRADGDAGVLAIRDDGSGFPEAPSGAGIGLEIMRYRASTIGGALHIDRGRQGPTTVTCRFPTAPAAPEGGDR